MLTASNFFTKEEQDLLVEAIANAELRTSGEIRLHVTNFCFGSEINAAGKIFAKLKMFETKERNGVLIYVAVMSRKIAVIGDQGIHQKLGDEFWKSVVVQLTTKFKEGQKVDALIDCITHCGEALSTFFPRKHDDNNELTNSISY